MKSTKLLMEDHEIILEALHVLDAMTIEMVQKQKVDFNDIRSILAFLREFSDGWHQVKEEAILFPALIQCGMNVFEGPLNVMTYEHERERALTAAMADALKRNHNDDFVLNAHRYIELLRQHIEKENYIFFEIADSTLSDEEDARIVEAMQEFESTRVGVPPRERLRLAIENLASKYFPVHVG